jgi:hypothetical protein
MLWQRDEPSITLILNFGFLLKAAKIPDTHPRKIVTVN